MNALKRIGLCGVVPVVVIEDAKDAVPTAKALYDGGVDVMEITFRTSAAKESIRRVAEEFPDICVGAGTVLTLDQAKAAVEAGAKFIVLPGFNREVVKWCVENDIAVTPGCVTPTEIMEALGLGVEVLKFFPANVYGGLDGMKALSAPFGKVKFIPTGGVSDKNLAEYVAAPFVYAVGGSWLCNKADIAAGNFDTITDLCKKARQTVLGYEVAHVGVNCDSGEKSAEVCGQFSKAFGFEIKEGNSSNFSSPAIEVTKQIFPGKNGHIAIRTANMERAVEDLKKKGFSIDMETAKYKGEKMIAVYLTHDFGGFAVHLLQK
ncbi:bifunctional 4-hydroxy-2-oxoglutarate aldolase/2-dehydro-3-deoxy-phosphogluconate aldolase [Thermoclostridium caenicola]|uniref:2-dehydro-3-deoxy-phosphogluconate aldolase n=1 Tax=Thermoclostridium caenicola TaxID=659425 RepID=A0A1M6G3J1_9FIRM|nr:bifunctional 4-hydroxy-2-oxoglutarate aldolase/2-dehydro-3-deoxy-phosphogluconate aldolase [Thermoclostridium caenicola]SHJ04450.1 2-dehydro-3-deoxyphosphogluconate aldolase / (4S)-4-hydroxy-2-oxoglutarate aldolase [Thermoclostridium caenicola]